jgi:pyruvate-formate lyase-activating enzyme
MFRNCDDVCLRVYQSGKDLERVYRCYLELRNLVIHGFNDDLHDLKDMP